MKIANMVSPSKDVWALGLVFIIGAGLRLFNIGEQGLFLDEAWSWAVSKMHPGEILQLSLQDPHPAFYYILLKGTLGIIPDTEAGVRLLSAAYSLVSLISIMAVAARWWNPRAAIYAGGFLALSSFDIYYAQEARMYTLLGLLWFLAFVFLVEALRGFPRILIIWGFTCALLGWTHFYGL